MFAQVIITVLTFLMIQGAERPADWYMNKWPKWYVQYLTIFGTSIIEIRFSGWLKKDVHLLVYKTNPALMSHYGLQNAMKLQIQQKRKFSWNTDTATSIQPNWILYSESTKTPKEKRINCKARLGRLMYKIMIQISYAADLLNLVIVDLTVMLFCLVMTNFVE